MPWMKQAMIDILTGKYGDKYEDEIAIIWFTRGDIEDHQEVELTDDEWDEIAGRFNDMDWQYVSEEIDELVQQVMNRRGDPCEE
jgi:hypothetical protein